MLVSQVDCFHLLLRHVNILVEIIGLIQIIRLFGIRDKYETNLKHKY